MRPSSQCFHISPPQVVLRIELCASLKLMPFEQLDPHLRELCLLLREDSHAGRRLRCDQRGVRTHDHRSTLTAPGAEGTTALDSVRCPLLARAQGLCSRRRQGSFGTPKYSIFLLACDDQLWVHRCLSKTACEQDLQLRTFVS